MRLRLLAVAAVVLATGSTASAGPTGFGVAGISITADGISPKSLRIKAASSIPVWSNLDAVAHTVTFDDERCVLVIAAGGRDFCNGPGSSFRTFAGRYRYRVSDLIEPTGEIVVVPNERRVTMVASRATARAGQAVVLRGSIIATRLPPFGDTPTPTVTLLRRMAGSQRFLAIRRVPSTDCLRPYPSCALNEAIWSTAIHPRTTATYIARVADPPERIVWERAVSRRVSVRVSSSPRSASKPRPLSG